MASEELREQVGKEISTLLSTYGLDDWDDVGATVLYAIEDLTRTVERESTETRLLLYAGAIRAKLDARGI